MESEFYKPHRLSFKIPTYGAELMVEMTKSRQECPALQKMFESQEPEAGIANRKRWPEDKNKRKSRTRPEPGLHKIYRRGPMLCVSESSRTEWVGC
jgi:hypothetical protein